jgi:hypothetical protein
MDSKTTVRNKDHLLLDDYRKTLKVRIRKPETAGKPLANLNDVSKNFNSR